MTEDLFEQSELCMAEGHRFETISKTLNKLSASRMIDDELLDSIIERRSAVDKENELQPQNEPKNEMSELKTDAKNELKNDLESTRDRTELPADASNEIKKEADATDADNVDEDGEF